MEPPELPEGATRLTAEEAVEALLIDNPEAENGSLVLDSVLIQALREGWVHAIRLPDRRISFWFDPEKIPDE